MILKEKFNNPIMRHDLGRNEIEETKEQCAEIADEFAIGFADWMISKAERYNSYLCLIKDYKELLEIYKKEKEL